MDRLNLMETFVCAVETGSFSAAVRRLDVGQPAVSKAIAQLEERLQTRLLLRSTRGLSTTEAGQAYYESAKRAIALVDDADSAARGAAADLVGKLRVCAAVTFARLHIIPHLKRFLDRHPALEVEVMLDDRNIDLLEHGIDVALRMGDLGDSSMTARRIARGPRIVAAAPGYLAARGVPRVPTDLAQHEAVVYLTDSGGPGTWAFQRDGTELSVTVNGRLRVSAAEGVRAAVCSGLGVAIVSEWMFAPELASGEVQQVLTEWTLPPIDLWAVYPSGRLASAKARAFTLFVEEIMADNAAAAAVAA
jgi:DNA-binding transcriptional LysR family regulator